MRKLFERPSQSIAQSPASSYSHFYLGYHCLDCILQRRALLVDRGDHRPHWHADIDQHGLGQLKAGLDCLRYRIRSANAIKMRRMRGVASASKSSRSRRAAATSSSAEAGSSSVTTRARGLEVQAPQQIELRYAHVRPVSPFSSALSRKAET